MIADYPERLKNNRLATIRMTQAYLKYNKVFAGLVQYESICFMKLFCKFTK